MKTLLFITLLLTTLSSSAVYAATKNRDLKEVDLPGDSRIKLLEYSDEDVYTITTRYGYQTNIVFGANEEIETISVGDRSVWQIIPAGNRLFIRPMDEDTTTNMTILTNKHSYQFDLKSIGADKTKGNIYVAKFVYKNEKPAPVMMTQPQPVMPEPAQMAAPMIPVTTPDAPESNTSEVPHNVVSVPSPFGYAPSMPLDGKNSAIQTAANEYVDRTGSATLPNYNYTYEGSDDAAPVQVYDDGKSTYIKLNNSPESPPIVSVINANNSENPIGASVKNGFIVVDGVVGELTLKNKGEIVRIFNENISPR
jgi:type IV secretion system protein VirB9